MHQCAVCEDEDRRNDARGGKSESEKLGPWRCTRHTDLRKLTSLARWLWPCAPISSHTVKGTDVKKADWRPRDVK